jgi:hypothetical protein
VLAVIRHLVVRTITSRMSVACVALLFTTMGGARRMDAHALSGHGSHFGHIIAQSEPVVSHDHSAHAGHHGAASDEVDAEQSQPPEEQSSEECTCVGPCQGGTPPNVTQPTAYVAATHEVASAPHVARTVHRVYHDPTSHLLPLPNAPPARV